MGKDVVTTIKTGVKSSETISGLMNGTEYHVVVTALDASGESQWSSEVTATPHLVPVTTEIDLGGGIKMNFAQIPAGTFQMGEVFYNEPVHQVTISRAFYMGQYEVTQAHYKQLMGTNPSYFTATQTTGYTNTDNQPVEQVSWFDAVRFCNALSENQGLTPCYTNQSSNTTIADNDTVTCNWSATGYRLPTEAEWEYACRGGTTSTYYWGSDTSETTIKQYAWYQLNSNPSYWTTPHADKGGIQPIGTKLANAFGLYDMLGNVSEWAWDSYGSYSSNAQIDPKGADSNSSPVYRGGGWGAPNGNLRSADRIASNRPTDGNAVIGFRVCRTKE